MRKAPLYSQTGFTLVELMIGATLSAAIMAAVLSSYIYLGRGLARLANQQIIETEARRTLGYFSQDVQSASGLTDTANLSATRLSLTVSSSAGSNTITYYYNSTAATASAVSDNVTINGISVAMRREALTRCVYNGTTVTSLLLLRNITSSGLALKYYDNSGNPYTSYVNYLPGIKQVSLQFTAQLGTAANNTRTLAYASSTGRLILRNDTFLQ